MERTDWLLIALAEAGSRGLTPVQLQQDLFLLGRNKTAAVGADFYHFVPYNYGPFCTDVYRDAEALAEKGLVSIEKSGRRWPEYYATAVSKEYLDQILKKADSSVVDYLGRVVRWAQSLSFPELVRAIYEKYPEFKQNSVF